jgi:hypothetical protein
MLACGTSHLPRPLAPNGVNRPKGGVKMWLFDFNIFYLAGQALLLGNSPYSVGGFYSPLPLAVFFIPFALLPKPIAYAIYIAVSLLLLWKVAGKHSFWAILSFPVLFTLFVGQIDLLIALSISLLGPFAFPLLLAKPQLGFVVLPWLCRNVKLKKLALGCLITLGILAICFLLRPNWIQEWLTVIPTLSDYSRRDSTLYWLISHQAKEILVWIVSPIVLIVGFLLLNRRSSWVMLHLFTPVSNIYSASILAEWIGPVEMILSWLVMLLIGGYIHNGAPMFVVGLSILIRNSPVLINLKSNLLDRLKRKAG